MNIDQPSTPARKPGGILITQGMRVGIPPGGFSIAMNEQGELSSNLKLHLSIDVSDHWLRIAMHHVHEANRAKAELDLVWPSGDDATAIPLLETEFMHGMQAIGAAGFALDAFYAHVKEHAPIPKETQDAWCKNGTSRDAQVGESFRRAFRIDQKSARKMRKIISAVFTLRDLAVHPPAAIANTVWHPRLQVGMEWRLVQFRAEEAQGVAGFALSLPWQLVHLPKAKFPVLVEYCRGALLRFNPVMKSWESAYGPLYDHAAFEALLGRSDRQ